MTMVLTFRNVEPDYTISLDLSYMWAVNHLFDKDYQHLIELVYPVGPLGFLLFPTTEGSNFLYMLLFYILLKCWFVVVFLGLAFKVNPNQKLLAFVIILVMSYFGKTQFLLIGICAMHCLWFLENKKMLHIALSVVLAFVGLCIKTAIGINLYFILAMTFLINVFLNKNIKEGFKFIGVALIVSFCVGLLIFHSPILLFDFYHNSLKLALAYSDALCLHPPNNWFLLAGFLASILLLPIFTKDKNSCICFFLFLPSFFAMWKHSMAREDHSHGFIMVYFLVLFWGIIIMYAKTGKIKLAMLAILGSFLYYFNLHNIPDFDGLKIDFYGGDNFVETVFDYENYHKKYKQISIENVQANKLDTEIVAYIGDSSIDVYPWELSFMPANNFNWKPRKTLQGGSFAQWLDELSAIDFDEKNGPEFILFHYVKDNWGGNFGSIDGRFLLNDNPRTIISILDNYFVKFNTEKYLLFEKNKGGNIVEIREDEVLNTAWNQWLDIDITQDEILRMKFFSENTILGKIKNFLYKSEPYFIDYLFDDGKYLTYRFIPQNAKDGLWIHPFVQYPSNTNPEQEVVKVRLRNTNDLFDKSTVNFQIEHIKLDTKEKEFKSISSHLFLKDESKLETNILTQTVLNFDDPAKNQPIAYQFEEGISFSENYSNKIFEQGFSVGFKHALDSLWSTIDSNVHEIVIEAHLKCINQSFSKLIMDLKESDTPFWEGMTIPINTRKGEWEYFSTSKKISRKHNGKLLVCVWNLGNQDIYIVSERKF